MHVDLAPVRVHTDERAALAADLLAVRAFTSGVHIFLGAGERPTDVPLMVHELAHVVQQQGAPAVQLFAASPADGLEVEAQRVSAVVAGGGGARVTGRSGDRRAQGFSVTGWIADKAWDLVESIAPEIVPILRMGIGEWLREKLSDALAALHEKLMAPVRAATGFIDTLTAHFGNLVAWMREAASKIARGDCSSIAEAADRIRAVVNGLAAPVIDRVKHLAAKVGDFFTNLWNKVGAPVWDFLKSVGGAVWDKLSQLGNWIWEKTAPVRKALSRAWTWVKDKLGIGEGPEGQNGLLQWVQRKAGEAWDWIKAKLEPIRKPLMVVGGILLMLSPAGPVIAIGGAVYGLIRGVSWLASQLRSSGSVVGQRGVLEGTIIPGIMRAVDAVTGALGRAAAFITDKLSGVMSGLGQLVSAVGGSILRFAVGAVRWISEQFGKLAAWAREKLTGLAEWVRSGLDRLRIFLQPVLDVLRTFGAAIGDLWQIVKLVVSRAWHRIPACIKDPIVNFLINQILKRIPLLSSLLEVPNIWAKVKDTALKAIRQVFVNGDIKGALWTIFRFLLDVLQVPVELVKSILAKAGAAIDLIRDRPLQFLKTFLSAVWEGFKLFSSNAVKHLIEGVLNWFAGQLAEASIPVPTDWTIGSILKLVLDIAGVTVEKVFQIVAKKLNPGIVDRLKKAVNVLTGAWRWVATLIREGPAGLWKEIQDQIGKLKEMLIDALVGWVSETVIGRAALQLITALNPAGAVVNAIIALYSALKTAVQYLARILGIVDRVLDTIGDLARGVSAGAAEVFQSALAKALPVAIGFLANYLNLGRLATRVREMVEKIQKKVVSALEWLVDKAINSGRAVLDALGGKKTAEEGVETKAQERLLTKLQGGRTREATAMIVAEVAAEFRPQGVKQLQLGAIDAEGRYSILIESSPLRPFIKMVPKARWRSKMRSVAQVVVEGEPITTGELAATAAPAYRIDPRTGSRTEIPSAYRYAEPPAGQSVVGAAVILPRPSTKLQVVSWATEDYTTGAATSHAERYFVEWLEEQRWKDRIVSIGMHNLNLNPCQYCGGRLAGLLRDLNRRRPPGDPVRARIQWSSPWPEERLEVIQQTLAGLRAATWTVVPPIVDPTEYKNALDDAIRKQQVANARKL